MRRFAFLAAGAVTVATVLPTHPARAEKLEKPAITTTMEGRDLHVVVHDVTDYCSTDADTQILRTSESIRIVRERPHRASRCIATSDVSFVVKDVSPGRYMVTYERMPLVAPARPVRVAFTMATVP